MLGPASPYWDCIRDDEPMIPDIALDLHPTKTTGDRVELPALANFKKKRVTIIGNPFLSVAGEARA